MANLFSIDKDLFDKLSKLEEMDYNEETGEYTDPDTGEVFTMDDIMVQDDNRKTKLANIALFIRQLDNETQIQKKYGQSILAKAKAKENTAQRLRASIMRSMSIFGDTKVKDDRVTISTRATETVNIVNIDLLPREFVQEVITLKSDNDKIKKAIQSGEIIAGAELKQNVSLIIR